MKQEDEFVYMMNLVRISIYSYLIIVISVIYNLSPVVLFFIFAKRTHIKSIATDSNKTIKYLKAIRSFLSTCLLFIAYVENISLHFYLSL